MFIVADVYTSVGYLFRIVLVEYKAEAEIRHLRPYIRHVAGFIVPYTSAMKSKSQQ